MVGSGIVSSERLTRRCFYDRLRRLLEVQVIVLRLRERVLMIHRWWRDN